MDGLASVHILRHVQDALRRPMSDKDIDIVGDRLPNCVNSERSFM